jgi:ribosome-associated translation inhibitor RaiA
MFGLHDGGRTRSAAFFSSHPIRMAQRNAGSRGKKPRQRQERRATFPVAVPKPHKRSIGRSTTAETPLHVRARGLQIDDELREYIRARTSFKLGKYGLSINRITVRLENVAGPKGAPAYSCKFKVLLLMRGDVVLAVIDESARAAFDAAVDAAERAVRKMVSRSRKPRRRPQAAR